jgi:hypothetical protein
MRIGIKTISLYILFVGIPLLGVLAAVWVGAGIAAPASVGGDWALHIPEQPAMECLAFAGWSGEMQMVISQSGSVLLIVFNDPAHTAMTGSLTGLSIAAETSNATPPVLQLAAEVDRQTDPHQLSGTLQATGCDHPLNLSAVLLPPGAASQEH